MTAHINWLDHKMPDAGNYAVFSGAPDIESSQWVAADLSGYRKVIGTLAADKGGLVYTFVIPPNTKALASVAVVGKLGVASQNAINIRVKDGTNTIATSNGAITAATKTTATITSFSPAPDLTEGNRIIVEVEGDVDLAETAFIGSATATFTVRL